MNRSSVANEVVRRDHPVWALLMQALREEFPSRRARALLESVHLLEGGQRLLRVAILRDRLGPWLQDGTLLRFEGLVRSLSGGELELALVPGDGCLTPGEDPSQTMGHFVAGPSNQAALETAQTLVRSSIAATPLFVWGPSGAGKTHLLRAIAHALASKPLGRPVLYRSAEALWLETVTAIWGGDLAERRSVLGGAGVLIVDDLQSLGQQAATRSELAAVLEGLIRDQFPVILAADRPPSQLNELGGALHRVVREARPIPLAAPEWETRVAIFLDRALMWGTRLRADVASWLATGVSEDLHRLDGVLTRAMLLRHSVQEPVEAEHVRRALAPGPLYVHRPPPEVVLEVVAHQCGIRVRTLRAKDRKPPHVRARQLAAYLLRNRCGLSYPEIGKRLGRDHSTTHYSVQETERRLGVNASLANLLSLVEKDLSLRTEKKD